PASLKSHDQIPHHEVTQSTGNKAKCAFSETIEQALLVTGVQLVSYKLASLTHRSFYGRVAVRVQSESDPRCVAAKPMHLFVNRILKRRGVRHKYGGTEGKRAIVMAKIACELMRFE